MMMMGASEMLILLLFAGGPASDLLGIPPGERDAALVHAAAADSIVYFEWAERGQGKEGAEGVDGLVADPEVKHFLNQIVTAIKKNIEREFAGDNGGQTRQRAMFQALPEFVMAFSGRPGCLSISLKDDGAGGGDPLQALAMRAQALLVVNAGDKADEFSKTIGKWLSEIPGIAEPEKLDKIRLPLPVPAIVHRHEDYIILGIGQDIVDKAIERLTKKEGGLATNERFAAGWKELELKRTGNIGFIDLKSGAEELGELLGQDGAMIPMVMEATGIGNIEHIMSVTGVVDGMVRARVKAWTNGKLEGLMAAASGRAIVADDFRFVPNDSDVVMALSVDAGNFMNAIRELVGKIEPGAEEDFDEGVTEFEEEFGLSVKDDILEAFGNVVTLSNSPGDGGFVASMPVLTLEVKKPASAIKTVRKFAAYFDKHSTQLEENGSKPRRRGEYLERKEFMGQRIYMMNFVGDDDYIVSPTWAVNRTHFMFSLHPQAIKSRIRRMKRDSWKPYDFKPKADGDMVAFSAARMKDVLPKLYGFTPWFASSIMAMTQREGIEMDAFDYPSAAGLLPYMSDSQTVVLRTPTGLYAESNGPPLVGTIGALPVLSTPVMLFGFRVAAPRPAAVRVIEAPADAVDEAIEIREEPQANSAPPQARTVTSKF